jgi:hypothetical protein
VEPERTPLCLKKRRKIMNRPKTVLGSRLQFAEPPPRTASALAHASSPEAKALEALFRAKRFARPAYVGRGACPRGPFFTKVGGLAR